MSKHDAAPTFGWVLGSKITKWLSMLFVFTAFIVFLAVWTVTYTVRRDCSDVYTRNVGAFGYWLHVQAGSTKAGCPQK
jgi:hypothetical protein